MGGKQSKWANENASVFLNLPSDQFNPGDYLQGQIEILVKNPFKVSYLDLVLTGNQQTQWWIHTDKVHIRFQGKNKIISQRFALVSFNGNQLAPGFHKIDFGLEIPSTLPGSFLWYHTDWFAKIEYKLTIELKAVNKKESLEYERFLLVQEKQIKAQEELKEMVAEHKVRTICCIPRGISKLRASFEKNEFKVNEVARALLSVDNSACKVAIKKITLLLKRKILMYSDRNYKISYSKTVAKQQFPGVGKLQKMPDGEWRFLELDLKKFVTEFLAKKAKKYKKIVWKHYGDYFLQPTTNTKLIHCNYFVQIEPDYDVCCLSCSGAPKVILPIALGIPEDQRISMSYEEESFFRGVHEGQEFFHEVGGFNYEMMDLQAINQDQRSRDSVTEPLLK